MDTDQIRNIARWMTDNLQDYISYGEEVDCTSMAEDAAIAFCIENDNDLEELFELSFDVSHEEGYA